MYIWGERRVQMHQSNQHQARPWGWCTSPKDNQHDYHISELEDESILSVNWSFKRIKKIKIRQFWWFFRINLESLQYSWRRGWLQLWGWIWWDPNEVKKINTYFGLNGKESRDLIKSFYETNLLKLMSFIKISKV